MTYQRNELRELAQKAIWYADTYQWWYPGKRITLAVLKRAAEDEAVADAFAARRVGMQIGAGDEPGPAPSLADLIRMVFEVMLLIYGPALPFGGYWVRAVRDFVLQYLEKLPPVRGLRYGSVR